MKKTVASSPGTLVGEARALQALKTHIVFTDTEKWVVGTLLSSGG